MLTTADYLFAVTVYVGFRSSRPDIVTWLRVQQDLLQNGIDIRQLIKWPKNHCHQADPSTEEEVPHRYPGVGKGK